MARRTLALPVRTLTPPLQSLHREGMHRLIPSLYSGGGTVLEEIAEDDAMLADIMLLDGATNDRIQGEHFGLSGISNFELVYGIPNAHIIRAAFLHTSQTGSRFSDATRGAWYAADELETSLAEVTYHKVKRLADIVVPGLPYEMPDEELCEYDDWQADFHAAFHTLEPAESYVDCLQPEPVPQCYRASQLLAKLLLDQRSNGLIYPSVRYAGGRCVVCFRPALVYRPTQAGRYEIQYKLIAGVYETKVRSVPL